MEAAFRTELNERELEIYVDALETTPTLDLVEAVADVIRTWRPQFGVNFPPIYDVLDAIQVVHGRRLLEKKTAVILERNDKPPTWEALREKAGVSHEQVQAWREAGKQAQRQHIAELERDPEWQLLYVKFAQARRGRPRLSTVPEEGDERSQWAKDQAEKQGWR